MVGAFSNCIQVPFRGFRGFRKANLLVPACKVSFRGFRVVAKSHTDILFFLLLSAALSACQQKPARVFVQLSSERTGIHFNNLVDEDEENNVNTYMNIYTGGGVAAGDINNDGLTDL